MSRTWRPSLATLPGLGVSLLPKLACPLCWPAYAGLLSSLGLGFLISVRYLLPLTAAFLAVALAALVFRAKHRHGFGPFLLGLLAAVVVLAGKFQWESKPVWHAAVGLLIAASLWNAWPNRGSGAKCFTEINKP